MPGTPSNALNLVGTGGAPVTLGNVAPGTLSATSTQAVNGSQLYATNQTVAGLQGGTLGLVQQDPATGAITVGAATGGTSVDLTNNAGAARTLAGVAAGTVAAGSTQAVNGGQLQGTAASLAAGLGGGAAVNPDGTVSAPAYTVGNQTYANVGSALAAGNALGVQYTPDAAGAPTAAIDLTKGGTLAPVTVTGLANATTPTGAVALGQVPLQYSTAAAPTTANPAVPSNDVTLVGATAGTPVALHNVAAGTLTATATDAVNGSQLYATNTQVAGNTTAIGTLTNAVNNGTTGPVQRTGAANQLALIAPGGSAADPGAAQSLTNVAAGALTATSTDAVNGSQLSSTNTQLAATTAGVSGLANVLGGTTTFNAQTGAVTGPVFNVNGTTQTTYYAAINALAQGASGGGIAYFHANSSGADSTAGGIDSVAVGPAATTGAAATGSLALGANSSTTGADSVALGSNSVAGPANIAGTGTAAALTNASGATTAITYNTTDRTLLGPVSVGSSTSYRQIQNVADGQAPTDAVNVRQLQGGVQTAIDYTDTHAVEYSQNGGVTLASPYAGGPVVIHNVGAGAVTATSTDAVNGSQLYGVQQTALNSVQYDAAPDGTRSNTITLAGGTASAPVRLSNVAPGIAGTDAVNVNQVNNMAAYNQTQFNNLNTQISNTNTALRGGVAVALAAAGLRYDDRPGKVAISAGASGYGGSAGLAFGLGGTSDNGRLRYNAAVSFSPNNSRADVGVFGGGSYTFN